MASAAERAERASELRKEAYDFLSGSGLFQLLADTFAQPTVTGSASYNLMVWRDIDIHMAVEADRWGVDEIEAWYRQHAAPLPTK